MDADAELRLHQILEGGQNQFQSKGSAAGGDVFVETALEIEDRDAAVDMNLVMTGAGRFVEIQGTGEEATFTVSAEGLLNDYGIHTDRYLEHMVHNKYMR